MIAHIIRDILIQDVRIQKLIGNRIYPLRAPAKTQSPYIVFDVLDTNPNHTKDGDSRLDETGISLTAWSDDYHSLEKIYNVLRQILQDRQDTEIATGYFDGMNDLFEERANSIVYGKALFFDIRLRFWEYLTDEEFDFIVTEDNKKLVLE